MPRIQLSFSREDIQRWVGPVAYARGAAYATQARVTEIEDDGDDELRTLSARVRGSEARPYTTAAALTRRRNGTIRFDSDCSCPLGSACKHVAALLIARLNRTTPREKTPAREDEPPIAPLIVSWAERIAAAVPVDDVSAPNVGTERIAYVLLEKPVAYRRNFPLRIVVTRRSKAGTWTQLREMTAATLETSTARAMTGRDALLGRLIRAYELTFGDRSDLGDDILNRLIDSGRAGFATAEAPPLSLGPPRSARLAWTLAPDGTQRSTLAFDDAADVVIIPTLGWYVEPQRALAGPIDAGIPRAALIMFLEAPPLNEREARWVRDRLTAAGASAAAVPAPHIRTERTQRIAPVPHLALRSVQQTVSDRNHWNRRYDGSPVDEARLAFAYGEAIVASNAAEREVRHATSDAIIHYERRPRLEAKAVTRLESLGLYSRDRTEFVFFNSDDWPRFIHRDLPVLRAEGWQIEIEPSFRFTVVDLSADTDWHAEIEERSAGWFDVGIGVDIDGKRIDLLPILAALVGRGDLNPETLDSFSDDETYYVTLSGLERTLALPLGRIRAIVRTLVELSDPDLVSADGMLTFPRARAALIGELEAAAALRLDASPRLRSLGERLRKSSLEDPVVAPATFTGVLRDYQQRGLEWLQFLAQAGLGGILADDMGLGKSVQTLAHLACEQAAGRLVPPALLIVPTSLVHNWCDEAARFAPQLRILPLHGLARAARFAEIDAHDVVITTYALLLRDTTLHERAWSSVIFDEAQALKNPQAKVAQIAMGMQAAHRICLTGTPVENHLGDLWSLASIALPGLLGDRKQFGRIFRTPIEKHGDPERKRALASRVAPFLLRRTKEAVARELPEKTEIVQRIDLVGAQRDLYETVRLAMHDRVQREIAKRGLARSQIVILDALLKLRQVCCDPRLLPERMRHEAPSAKLDLLFEMLPSMIEEGRRILVFSQFTSMLALIEPELTQREIPFSLLTGDTRDRANVVRRFQSGEVPVFLISLKAGGTGLNLTAADTVIHYDPWWNPAVERQATDRAHRIGQTRPVFVYKLIGAGTVEEKIIALQERKADLAAAIYADDATVGARFAAEDVDRLFAPLASFDSTREPMSPKKRR